MPGRSLSRRDETCPTGLYLCGNGGCCPAGRSCGVTDCPIQSQGPATAACSQSGYTACAIEDGGDCCPSGFACAQTECIPPSGFSMTSDNCAVGSTLCPATLGFGCCGTDFDCGLSTCYPRTTSSFVATLSVVTTDAQSSATTQVTVVATAYIPASASTSSGPAFPKASSYTTTSSFAPVAKVSSTSALTGGGGGLSPAAIGGLGGGVGVGLFVVVAVLAWLFRRSRHLPHGGWSHGSSTLGQTSHANGGSRGFFRPKHKHKTSDPDIFALSGSGRVDSSGYYAAAAKSDESASDRFVGIDIPRLPQRECFGDLNIPHSPSSDVTRPPFDRTGSDGSASTMRRDHEEESVGQPPTSIQGDVVSELADTDLRSSRANVLFGFANPWQSGAARNRLPSVAEGDTNQTVPE